MKQTMQSTLRNIKHNLIMQILTQLTLHNYIATACKRPSSPETGTQRNQTTTSLRKRLSREFLTSTYLPVLFQDFRASSRFSYRNKQRRSFRMHPRKTKAPLLLPAGPASASDFPRDFFPRRGEP